MSKPMSEEVARKNWPQYAELTSVYAFCDALAKRDVQLERAKADLKDSWADARQNAERLIAEIVKRDHAVSVLAKMLADAESQLAAAKAAFRETQKAQTP